jgi:hypothetical protein
MVEKRRTIAQALELNPEKLAFIHGVLSTDQNKPDSAGESKGWNELAQADDNVHSRTEAPEPTIVRPRSRELRSRERTLQSSQDPQRRPKGIPRENYDADNFNEVLVPLTTRLRPATAEALRRVCLQQKLSRRKPDSTQEIVEQAIRAWLTASGLVE